MQAARSGTPPSAPPASTPSPTATTHASASHLLDPSEIEELMAQSQTPRPARSPQKSVSGADILTAADIDALISGGGSGARADQTLQHAQRQLDRAMASDPPRGGKAPPVEFGSPQPFGFPDFGPKASPPSAPVFPIAALEDVELDLRIELGRTELLIEEVLQLREGTVVPLDKLAGDPVDILVNGRLIARGEVLVLNDNFCVRVAEILTPEF